MSKYQLQIQLVSYEPKYRHIFRELNESWIRDYFKMEAKDYESLMHPERSIIEKGGEIVVALLNDQAVGVCALMRMDHPDYDYELAKMGVAENVRGQRHRLPAWPGDHHKGQKTGSTQSICRKQYDTCSGDLLVQEIGIQRNLRQTFAL